MGGFFRLWAVHKRKKIMELSTAINTMLIAAGEATTNALDFTHPLQRSLLDTLTNVSRLEQSKGWWFNEYRTLLEPDTEGRITLADDIARIRPSQGQRKFVKRGQNLLDQTSRSDIFDRPVEAWITELWDFEDLPDTFALYVTALAAVQSAVSYDADAARIQALGTAVDMARQPMMKEHVDNIQLNMLSTNSMGGKLLDVRMHRYGGSR